MKYCYNQLEDRYNKIIHRYNGIVYRYIVMYGSTSLILPTIESPKINVSVEFSTKRLQFLRFSASVKPSDVLQTAQAPCLLGYSP